MCRFVEAANHHGYTGFVQAGLIIDEGQFCQSSDGKGVSQPILPETLLTVPLGIEVDDLFDHRLIGDIEFVSLGLEEGNAALA